MNHANDGDEPERKSTVEEIRRRFDGDVERFSNLETGQTSTIDAPLAMDLVTQAAAAVTPSARNVLDIGCGAGNYTLRLLEHLPNANVTLVDLSRLMLDRAVERISPRTSGTVKAVQADIRDFSAADQSYDIVMAAAVLHHLRTDQQWRAVFRNIFGWLRPGGSFWVFDLVTSGRTELQDLFRSQYGKYLTALRNEEYRDHVFRYIEQEDTPRPLMDQLELLRDAGFTDIDVLHRHACFAAFGGVKALPTVQPESESTD